MNILIGLLPKKEINFYYVKPMKCGNILVIELAIELAWLLEQPKFFLTGLWFCPSSMCPVLEDESWLVPTNPSNPISLCQWLVKRWACDPDLANETSKVYSYFFMTKRACPYSPFFCFWKLLWKNDNWVLEQPSCDHEEKYHCHTKES